MSEGLISDLATRVKVLESPRRPSRATAINPQGWHYFQTEIPVLYSNPTATTDWADLGLSQYVPSSATEVLLFCAVEDTNGGTGRTVLRCRGGGVDWVVASLYETLGGASDSSGTQSIMPCSAGRVDWRVVFAPSAIGANVRIELLGWR